MFMEKMLTDKFDEWVTDVRFASSVFGPEQAELGILAATGALDRNLMRCLITYLSIRLVTETPVKP
jgi:hypothetical protein